MRAHDGGEQETVGLLGFLGYVLGGKDLEMGCLPGMIAERRAGVGQRKKYMHGIKDRIRCERICGVLRLAEDRSTWRSIVANINIDTALQ